jgi:hypothetical protein
MGLLAAAVALLFLCLSAPRSVADVVGVQLIGERAFPNGDATVAGTLAQLGGLTALSYDHSLDRWFAASNAEQRCDCPTWFVKIQPTSPADCALPGHPRRRLYKFSIDLSIDTLFNLRNGRRCQSCVSWPVELDIRTLPSWFCLSTRMGVAH